MKRDFTTIVAAAVLLLASCGGPTQLGGIQGSGSGVAYGPITGFGSIFVNGVEYVTSTHRFASMISPAPSHSCSSARSSP